jgi:hypothetical protein
MIFVNCCRLFGNLPKSKILMHDGFHLSRMAHNLLGETIGQEIVADIRTKNVDRFIGAPILDTAHPKLIRTRTKFDYLKKLRAFVEPG